MTMKNDRFPMRLVQATAVVMAFAVIGCNGSADDAVESTNVAEWLLRATFTDHGGDDIVTGDNARKMIKRSPHLVNFPKFKTRHHPNKLDESNYATDDYLDIDEHQPTGGDMVRPRPRKLCVTTRKRGRNRKRRNCSTKAV